MQFLVQGSLVPVRGGVFAGATGQSGAPAGSLVLLSGGSLCVVGPGVLDVLLLGTESLRTVVAAIVCAGGGGPGVGLGVLYRARHVVQTPH